ncbi:response regulator [Dyadobacter sediminis]|uniref:Response regulator transcription factor n=1 Tax=Dyadobacter sediminis TaxID=1493691 RepID=A0A5R9KEX9_9BACT|nr:response regulator transcription factor [Dyadobacter sediminis]TLU94685.1 response regulator transcription factor [Dyadobacter sediminis]GGB89041.1 DNA-binding response regulator [Dyadobacter sediminis]
MKITLVDELPILTSALQNLFLQLPHVQYVDIFEDGKEFLARKKNHPPDILILDLLINGKTGIQLVEICRNTFPKEMKIIVLSTMTDFQTIKHALKKGANGYMSKCTSFEELQECIADVCDGKQYIGREIRDYLINNIFTEDQIVMHLSPREKEVLQKVCSGQTIKEIAQDLKLSVHTIHYYHRCVMDKMKVKRTADLIVFAIQNKLYIP